MRAQFVEKPKTLAKNHVSKFRSYFRVKTRVLSLALAAAFGTQISGCEQYVQTSHIDHAFIDLEKAIEAEGKEGKLESAKANLVALREFKKIRAGIIDRLATPPAMQGKLVENEGKAEQWITMNRPTVLHWFDSVEQQATGMRMFIHTLSQRMHESESPELVARHGTLLVLALHYYRNVTRTIVEVSSPLMMGLGSEKFEKNENITAFKKELLDRVFAQLGTTMVLDKDITTVLTQLKDMRTQKLLPKKMNQVISKVQSETTKYETAKAAKFSKTIQKVDAKQRAEVDSKLAEIKAAYEGKTLLFTPGANSEELLNLISWIGNLTWGLVNTLIGLGIVIFAMVVSPFLDHVDFPRMAISQSGGQIYVDVTGLGPYPGKMSSGIWEFDNGSGYSFASGHERGHALQSAILGPLYFPVVLASYVASGWGGGFMEDWADAWAGDGW